MIFSAMASWERLAPRERRLVGIAAAVFSSLLTGLVAFLIYDGLSTLSDRNQAMRDALSAIDKNREEFTSARRLATQQESRISRTPLQLVTLVESAARDSGITANETSETPTVPSGKKYLQKGVEVKFRQVDLIQLTKFMKKLETGPNLVYVSRLLIKSRFNEHDKLDAEINVTTFERAPETAPKKTKPATGGKGGEKGSEKP